MSESSLASDWIQRLFSRFQAAYGNRMEAMWKNADPAEVRRAWDEELSVFPADDVIEALDAMRRAYTDWPPTLYQFADLCRDARKRRASRATMLEHVEERAPMPASVRAQLDGFLAKHRL